MRPRFAVCRSAFYFSLLLAGCSSLTSPPEREVEPKPAPAAPAAPPKEAPAPAPPPPPPPPPEERIQASHILVMYKGAPRPPGPDVTRTKEQAKKRAME